MNVIYFPKSLYYKIQTWRKILKFGKMRKNGVGFRAPIFSTLSMF
nr:MAG TPA: hypothetical protein [Bacteriophage sp.]